MLERSRSGASSASAATLSLDNGVWRYSAGAEANDVTAHEEGRQFVLADTAVTSFERLPHGCTPEPAEAGYAARCDAPGQQTLACSSTAATTRSRRST